MRPRRKRSCPMAAAGPAPFPTPESMNREGRNGSPLTMSQIENQRTPRFNFRNSEYNCRQWEKKKNFFSKKPLTISRFYVIM